MVKLVAIRVTIHSSTAYAREKLEAFQEEQLLLLVITLTKN